MRISWFRFVVVISTLFITGTSAVMATDIFVALRAYKGKKAALQKWQATADYLTQSVPGYRFILVPFENNSALNQAISQGKYHFCLTNPGSFVEHQIRYKAHAAATLVNKRKGKGYTVFGSVIFTRADRKDINKFSDLKNKVFIGADELGFGGWRIAWGELVKNNVNPFRDFKKLLFAGGRQQKVVYAVLKGQVDAGTVRTDMLEQMAEDGLIKLTDLKVIGSRKTKDFPFMHSTSLYPEWAFSVTGRLDKGLKKKVAIALLSISRNDSAAKMGRYVGWVPPVDYTAVRRLLQDLSVGPYRIETMHPVERLLTQYSLIIMVALIVITLLMATLIYLVILNRRIATTQVYLKAEIIVRERAENILKSLAQHSMNFSNEDKFFESCLINLAQVFDSRYSFIGLYSPGDKSKITTYAVWAGDRFVDNFEYDLKGTPCDDVLNFKVELIAEDAVRKYPDDKILADMNIESYYGAPLVSPSGEKMGLISVMDIKPMIINKGTAPILKIFANRIALELQRNQEEKDLLGMADQLSYQASHDVLTGLVNRREFEVNMKSALDRAITNDIEHALIYFDLDQFKIVNDTCGHMAGDELLIQLASRLSSVVRDCDTLARVGGDEFGILLLDCSMPQACEIAEKLLETIKGFRFVWEDNIFEVGASIGLVPINSASANIYELLKAADSACYVAKDQGRNRIHVYIEDDLAVATHQGEMRWLTEINRALNDNDFVLYKQKIHPLKSDVTVNSYYEILVRMKSEEGEVLLPGSFIAAAERYNLMDSIDQWVIENSFRYIHAQLLVSDKTQEKKRYAINLSALSICNVETVSFIENSLEKYKIDPCTVCFEITETAAISNYTQAIKFIEGMKLKGFRFSLDDFGTGLCSYAYLRSLPVDYLKIDGRFTCGLLDDPMNRAIIESIVHIAKVMNVQTIAEWVEEERIASELKKMDVDFIQGYYIGVPEKIEL